MGREIMTMACCMRCGEALDRLPGNTWFLPIPPRCSLRARWPSAMVWSLLSPRIKASSHGMPTMVRWPGTPCSMDTNQSVHNRLAISFRTPSFPPALSRLGNTLRCWLYGPAMANCSGNALSPCKETLAVAMLSLPSLASISTWALLPTGWMR